MDNFLKHFSNKCEEPFVNYKIILDENKQIKDVLFAEANKAFCELVNLKRKDIVGKKVSEIIKKQKNHNFKWEIFLKEKSKIATDDNFNYENRWFKIKYNDVSEYDRVVMFIDITNEYSSLDNFYQILESYENFLITEDEKSYYKMIADNLLKISGARFAALSLYDDDQKHTRTVALSGLKKSIDHALKILNIDVSKKAWANDEHRMSKIKDNIISTIPSFHELSPSDVSKTTSDTLHKFFGIGDLVVVKIMGKDKILADFTLFMDKNKKYKNDMFLKMLAKQIGLVIQRKRAWQDTVKSEEKYKLLTDEMQLGLANYKIITDKNNKPIDYMFLNTNKKFDEMLGMKKEDILGKTALELFPKTEHYWIEKFGEVGLTGKPAKYENYSIEFDRYYSLSAYSPKLGECAILIEDVTESKKRQKHIEYLSYNDVLTGVSNRRYYEENLHKYDIKENLPLSLIMFDVNGLKLTNDAFGNKTGDVLLQTFAKILKKEFDDKGMLARIGGDEFIALLPQTNLKETKVLIDKITKKLLKEDSNSFVMSASVGYAIKSNASQNLTDIYTAAENDMYKNKIYETKSTHNKTVDLIMNTLYERNTKEMLHSKRVSQSCELIAKEMNFSKEELNEIKIAGVMHDIGKIGISESILNKAGKLTFDEWQEIKKHPEIGYKILNSVNEFSHIANHVLQHHERMDGKGYPNGLMSHQISTQAKIIMIADSYDAMTKDRPYKNRLTKQQAIDEIKRCSGTQFDAEIANIFIEKVLKNNDI